MLFFFFFSTIHPGLLQILSKPGTLQGHRREFLQQDKEGDFSVPGLCWLREKTSQGFVLPVPPWPCSAPGETRHDLTKPWAWGERGKKALSASGGGMADGRTAAKQVGALCGDPPN